MQINPDRNYEFNYVASLLKEKYSRSHLIKAVMSLNVPVIWRGGRLLVSGIFVSEVLSGRIRL